MLQIMIMKMILRILGHSHKNEQAYSYCTRIHRAFIEFSQIGFCFPSEDTIWATKHYGHSEKQNITQVSPLGF